jgi:hypothetical protein
MRRRRWAPGLLLAGLALAELGLRLIARIPADGAYIDEGDLGIRLKPHAVVAGRRINAQGFNDREHMIPRPNGVTRLAVIGDSFVFGAVAPEENFVSLLQQRAREEGLAVEALNMGIPGAGLRTYIGLLRDEAQELQADLACVVLFTGNDVTQAHPDFRTGIWFGAPQQLLRSPFAVGRHSDYWYLYRLLRAGVRLLRERLRPSSAGRGEGTFSDATYLAIERRRLELFRDPLDGYHRRSVTAACELLDELAAAAEEAGIGLAVVLAPDEVQVSPALRRRLAERFNLQLEHYDFRSLQRRLAQRLAARGVPCLDLLPAFALAPDPSALYISNDSHWNSEGNRLAAREIWSFLEQRIRALADERALHRWLRAADAPAATGRDRGAAHE